MLTYFHTKLFSETRAKLLVDAVMLLAVLSAVAVGYVVGHSEILIAFSWVTVICSFVFWLVSPIVGARQLAAVTFFAFATAMFFGYGTAANIGGTTAIYGGYVSIVFLFLAILFWHEYVNKYWPGKI